MSGPYQIFGALALEAVLMFAALKGMALERGWQAPEKKNEPTNEQKRQQQQMDIMAKADAEVQARMRQPQLVTVAKPGEQQMVNAPVAETPK